MHTFPYRFSHYCTRMLYALSIWKENRPTDYHCTEIASTTPTEHKSRIASLSLIGTILNQVEFQINHCVNASSYLYCERKYWLAIYFRSPVGYSTVQNVVNQCKWQIRWNIALSLQETTAVFHRRVPWQKNKYLLIFIAWKYPLSGEICRQNCEFY